MLCQRHTKIHRHSVMDGHQNTELSQFNCNGVSSISGCDGLNQVQINSAVDKFINRKFKTGEVYFPNFREIKQLATSTNKEKNLKMTSEEVLQYCTNYIPYFIYLIC